MAALTRVAILFCGQGMATLIEHHPDGKADGVPAELVLVDFGGNQRYADEASGYVVEKLKEQQAAGMDPNLNTVIISHQDGDHVSLLPSLEKAIRAAGIEPLCDNWYLGGCNWSKTNQKKVQSFAAFMNDDDDAGLAFNEPFDSSYGSASTRAKLGHLTKFGKTFVRVVVSGLKLSSGGEDIIRNASSSVICVENGEWSMILPGDATYHTMAKVNDFYTKWKKNPLIPTVFVLQIPHHGALRTAVENYDAQKPINKMNFSIIETFAANLSPQQVVASAGPRNSHNHPVKEVIDVFDATLGTSYSRTYVAYVFSKKKATKDAGWEQFTTTKGIQTTVHQINGSMKYGNVYYDIEDSTASGQQIPAVSFQPRGTYQDLLARYGELAASDVWLRDAMQADVSREDDSPLRAPMPATDGNKS